MKLLHYLLFFILSYVYAAGVKAESRDFISNTSKSDDKLGQGNVLHTIADSVQIFLETLTTTEVYSSLKPTENSTEPYHSTKLIPAVINASSGNDSADLIQKALSSSEFPSNKSVSLSTKEPPSSKKNVLNTSTYQSTQTNVPEANHIRSSENYERESIPTTIRQRHSSVINERKTPASTTPISSLSSGTKAETLLSPTTPVPLLLSTSTTHSSDTTTTHSVVHVIHNSDSKSDPRKFPVPYFARPDELKEYHKKHRQHTSVFKHHLQIVPMIDTEYEPEVFKNHRYLLSVLIPLGVGAVGAILIAMTVLTLRHIARRRPRLDNPFDDDAEADYNNTRHNSRIASVCSETNDKAFLLMGEQDEE